MERRANNLIHKKLTQYRNLILALGFAISSILGLTAQQKEFDAGKRYTLNNITVTGTQNFNENTVIAFTGLRKGDQLYIPGERLSNVTQKLWEQNLFSDIAF